MITRSRQRSSCRSPKKGISQLGATRVSWDQSYFQWISTRFSSCGRLSETSSGLQEPEESQWKIVDNLSTRWNFLWRIRMLTKEYLYFFMGKSQAPENKVNRILGGGGIVAESLQLIKWWPKVSWIPVAINVKRLIYFIDMRLSAPKMMPN